MKRNGIIKKISVVLALLLLTVVFASCGANGTAEETATGNTETETASAAADESTSSADEEMFTARDKDYGYDETSAVKINLGSEISASDDSVTVNGTEVTVSDEGTYIVSGECDNARIKVEADESAKIQIVFDGVTVKKASSAVLYVKSADKVFLTLSSNNILTHSGEYEADGDVEIDSVIFAKDDLTVNGNGSLTITSDTGHGMVSKDDLKITGGEITIDAGSKALSGNDSVRIASATLNLTSGTDAIHAENTEDETKGFIYIESGDITINAGDDGMHASGDLKIAGGDITINNSYEGIEGCDIFVSGGKIDITSSDDGFNAGGGNDGSGTASFPGMPGGGDSFAATDASLNISGGEITVNSSGDGLDSNGSLYISGGTVYVFGPTDSGNGSIDYNGEGSVTGGTLIALGSSGMAQNMGSSSTQGSIMVNMNGSSGDAVSLKDSSGNILAQVTAEKQYSNIVISAPGIKTGETYTVSSGSQTQTVQMSSLIYGSGGGMGGGMQGGMPGGMQGEPGGMQGGPGGMGNV